MEYVGMLEKKDETCLTEIQEHRCNDNRVVLHGMVYTIRDMHDFAFVILRTRDGLVQCILEKQDADHPLHDLREECSVVVCGRVSRDPRAPHGFEIILSDYTVLSVPSEAMPLIVNKKRITAGLDAELTYRPIALRNERQRAIFHLQEGLVRGFRDFLHGQGFTEIHTPKIVAAGAEGGANIFKLDYFGKKAFLAQSPQFYKQMMVGVYERVYEVAPVYRAEKHNTSRHLNEYISMDLEMGFLDSFTDLMVLEATMLRYEFSLLENEYGSSLQTMGISLPRIPEAIPQVRFSQAKEMVAEKYGRRIKNPYDLEPEEELLIGKLFQEEYHSDFVFVTHYPSKKRPFYAMDDPQDPRYTLSFDLLFDGMEITTGGQRIHEYEAQVEKMKDRGLDPEEFASYLMIHRCGMPPHGGLGIGLERLLMKLIGENNVRHASLFPRDQQRLDP